MTNTIWILLCDDPDSQDVFISAHSSKEKAEAASEIHSRRAGYPFFFHIEEATVDGDDGTIGEDDE